MEKEPENDAVFKITVWTIVACLLVLLWVGVFKVLYWFMGLI